jgi:hypothetical protein
MVEMERTMEQTIGTTALRQRLTDVLHAVQEERATYIVATFERSQAALINLEEYRQFRAFQQEREAFFDWLDRTAALSPSDSAPGGRIAGSIDPRSRSLHVARTRRPGLDRRLPRSE